MKHSNGDVYEGMFEYDLCSKFGKMTYKDGSVYEGCWLNGVVRRLHYTAIISVVLYDLCSKFGKMTYKDGSVYEGSWLNGLVRGLHYTVVISMVSYDLCSKFMTSKDWA